GWVYRNQSDEPDLIYTEGNSGRARPSKRAQALCFVYGGKDSGDEPFLFNEMAATGLVSTRSRLQKLKHADSGTAEESQAVRRGIAAVEGFIVYAIRVGWMGMPDETLAAMRARLNKVKP